MMFKLLKSAALLLVLTISFISHSSLIETDLSADDYISYKGLDWAWASPVNVQYYFEFSENDTNELMPADYHTGWRVATAEELVVVENEITSEGFRRDDGSYIVAIEYWNNLFTYFNVSDFNIGDISSDWDLGSSVDIRTGKIADNYWFETFYVRDSATTIPEPAGVVLLLVALTLLLSRKHLTKALNQST